MVRSPGAISKAGDDTLIRIGPPNHPVLEAEDTRGRLPTITDLATCHCAVGIVEPSPAVNGAPAKLSKFQQLRLLPYPPFPPM